MSKVEAVRTRWNPGPGPWAHIILAGVDWEGNRVQVTLRGYAGMSHELYLTWRGEPVTLSVRGVRRAWYLAAHLCRCMMLPPSHMPHLAETPRQEVERFIRTFENGSWVCSAWFGSEMRYGRD